jgi:hypothetical protein
MREDVEVIEATSFEEGSRKLGVRLVELAQQGIKAEVAIAYSREEGDEVLRQRGYEPTEDIPVPVEGFADAVRKSEADRAETEKLYAELTADEILMEEEISDSEVKVETREEAAATAEEEPEISCGDENPLKGTLKIHVHEDGSVGYDIDENLNDLEIKGALRFTLNVFTELELANIRGALKRKAAEEREGALGIALGELIHKITEFGKGKTREG